MLIRFALGIALFVALVLLQGCGGRQSKIAHQQASSISDDTRRYIRIPDNSKPEVAQTAMGRSPDARQFENDDEVHYYLIKGAAEGEALRLVYRNGYLIGRSIVKLNVNQ